jgi:serine/threonine-protein kinase
VFALVAAVTGWILLGQTDKVAVPDVTNQKFEAAVLALKANNLKYTRTDEQNPTCTKGNVMAQSPAAGNRVEKGATVALTVCAGPATVKIPDVEGETAEDAQKALEDLGLSVKVEKRDGRREAGTVQGTDPKPGKEVKVNSTVTLYVSRGNKTVLPDVVGDTRDEAVSRLENADFNVNVEERPAEVGETPNTVVDQSPNGGASVFKNSTVTITVVTEPVASPSPTPTIPPTPTPTLTGDTVGYRSGSDSGVSLPWLEG